MRAIWLLLLLPGLLAAQSALPHIQRNTRGDLDILRVAPTYTNAGGLPSAASNSGKVILVTDTDGVSCSTPGATMGWCRSNGSSWILFGISGSAGFDAITGGTNTTAAMVVGSGASLAASGSGSITATAGDSATSFFPAGVLEVARGGVGTDLSATGGANQILKQSSAGSPVTVGQLNFTELAGTLSGAQAANVKTTDLSDIGCTTVAFSATANFDASLGSCFVMTLTADLTAPTLTNEVADRTLRFLFKQDVTGGHAVTYPAEFVDSCAVSEGSNDQTLVEAFVDSDGDVTIVGCKLKAGPDAITFLQTSGATLDTPPTNYATIFQNTDTGQFSVKKPGGSVVSLEAGDGVGVDQIADEDSNLTKRARVNFTGAGVTCVDDTVDSTDCTIPGGSSNHTLIGSDFTNRAATCNGTAQTAHTVSISANTFASGDTIRVTANWTLGGTTASKTPVVTYGNNSSPITRNQATGNTVTWSRDVVEGTIDSSTAQTWRGLWFGGDASTINSASSSYTFDVTTTLDMNFRCNCNAADSCSLDSYVIERIRP